MDAQILAPADLNLFAVALLLILVFLTFLLPRRFAFCPVLVMIGLMPMGQQIVAAGLHFHLFRILLLAGILRVLIRGELSQLKLTSMDKLFIAWAILSVILGTLSKPSLALFVNRSGDAYNALCCYFFARCVIVEFEDVITNIRALAFVTLPIAALMLVELTASHNLLSVFGGVPEFTFVRDGQLRCQGAFRHPILAGVFGATSFPLFFGLWRFRPHYRTLSIMAMGAAFVIVISAHSSGGLMALLAGIIGLVLWQWRNYMPLLRWGVLGLILVLAMVMKAPVWYLLSKLSDVTGGGGWHRAWLIDQAVGHFDEWWLFGTTYTAHWGPAGEVIAADPNMMDITNHFIAEGVDGGIVKLGLFLALIVVCFRGIGKRIRAEAVNLPEAFFVWAMGVSFFAHCLSFISANYFDQTILIWFWLQALICCVANEAPKTQKHNVDSKTSLATKYFRYVLLKKPNAIPRTESKTFRYRGDKA